MGQERGRAWCSHVCLHGVCVQLPLSVCPPLRSTAPHSTAHPPLCATGINIKNGVRGRGRGNGAGGHPLDALSGVSWLVSVGRRGLLAVGASADQWCTGWAGTNRRRNKLAGEGAAKELCFHPRGGARPFPSSLLPPQACA